MAEYTKEQFWKLYEKLPEELKDSIFSEETAENIGNICERNKVEGEKISGVAKYTGRVLLGVLPPDEFQTTLEKEVRLKKEVAKKVGQEINRFIFYPVKSSLEELYRVEIAPAAPPTVETPEVKPTPEVETEEPDVYREPVE